MASILTKRGNVDNVITYEHICDTAADKDTIDPHYITLGSTCIILHGDGGTLEIYMADSQKNWIPLIMGNTDNEEEP